MFASQNGKCAITKEELTCISQEGRIKTNISLDRIDSKIKDYSPENTRVVLTAVNKTLNEYGGETILPILKAMVAKIENDKLGIASPSVAVTR